MRREEAAQYLHTLDPAAAAFTFQILDHQHKLAPRVLHGAFDKLAPTLENYNRDGYDVYVTVSETDGRGRKKANIKRPRALWQEDDGDGRDIPLPGPHIVVETSPAHFHRYFLVKGITLEEHEGWERILAQRYGSDPAAVDCSRVLRVPGFWNHKRNCPVNLLATENLPSLTREQIVQALGKPVVTPSVTSVTPPVTPVTPSAVPRPGMEKAHALCARFETTGDPSRDDFLIAKELLVMCPDAEWVTEVMQSPDFPFARDKLLRPDYLPRTIAKAWAEVQAEVAVFEEAAEGGKDPFSLKRALDAVTGTFWLMEGIWRRGDMVAMLGHPNAGKTAVGLDLNLRIASGISLMNHRVARQRVFYLSAENPEEVLLRVRLWAEVHKVSLETLDYWFKICPYPVNLSDEKLVRKLATRLMEYGGDPFGVITIDTFSSTFGGDSENDAAQVMAWITNLRSHLMRPLNASALLMHHPPKGSQDVSNWRGSGVVTAALDSIWSVERTENVLTLTQHKRRGPVFEPLTWHTMSAPVGGDRLRDNFGNQVTAVVAMPGLPENMEMQFDQNTLRVLECIGSNPKASLRSIAEAVGHTHPTTAARKLDVLLRDGFIRENQHGRFLSQRGRDYVDYATACHVQVFDSKED